LNTPTDYDCPPSGNIYNGLQITSTRIIYPNTNNI